MSVQQWAAVISRLPTVNQHILATHATHDVGDCVDDRDAT